MCPYFKTKTVVAQNLIDDFFLTLNVRGPFHRKDFKWKINGGTGLISEKTEALHVELNESAEAATGYSVREHFLQYIYSVPVTKNHPNIGPRWLIHQFSFTDIFLKILIMVTEQLYGRKILCVCFCFVWLWLLISIMKRCAEWSALQLYTNGTKPPKVSHIVYTEVDMTKLKQFHLSRYFSSRKFYK